MGLNNASRFSIKNWLGLQTFASAQNLEPGWFFDSSNVVVTSDGSAACLRSPGTFNTALFTTNPILSVFNYDKQGPAPMGLFDIVTGGANSTTTYSTTGSANTSVRTGQANVRWQRANVNNWAYGLNGVEFVATNGTSSFSVGVTPPAAAPTISYVAGGSSAYSVGITASYAYRNSTTLEVSAPTAFSNTLGASGASKKVRVPVIASSQTGVDGIVFFFTVDGGSIRYLVIDSTGAPQVAANSSTNVDLDIGLVLWDTLTPEPSFNTVPPQNANFLFKYGNRLIICDFRAATTRGLVMYSAFESIYYGIPWSCFPPLNGIYLPNKGDAARGGIETPLGAIIFGEADSYLIRGTLSDNQSGPNAGITVSESIQAMGWGVGTRSPLTAKVTPFGPVWLDQDKRLQMWSYSTTTTSSNVLQEIGLPIRDQLGKILDTDAARVMAEGAWYQHGKDGGVYVLTASTTGTTNNKLFIISIYRDPEDNSIKFASAVSDIAAQSIAVLNVLGRKRLFVGMTDALFEIFDLDVAGAGWKTGQQRYFRTMVGNEGEWNYYHSLRFDCTSKAGLTVSISDYQVDDSDVVTLTNTVNLSPVQDVPGGPYYALIDNYGYRKVISFSWDATDAKKRVIQNLRVATSAKKRLL